jgi:hypothetical protein
MKKLSVNEKFLEFKNWFKTVTPHRLTDRSSPPYIQAMRVSFVLGLDKESEAKLEREISDFKIEDEIRPDIFKAYEAGKVLV